MKIDLILIYQQGKKKKIPLHIIVDKTRVTPTPTHENIVQKIEVGVEPKEWIGEIEGVGGEGCRWNDRDI